LFHEPLIGCERFDARCVGNRREEFVVETCEEIDCPNGLLHLDIHRPTLRLDEPGTQTVLRRPRDAPQSDRSDGMVSTGCGSSEPDHADPDGHDRPDGTEHERPPQR
jgi:hypothetical protein